MNMTNIQNRFVNDINLHKKIIYKICHSYCKFSEDRKDLEQEIMVQLWKSYTKFDNKFKFSTWMYRIALNVAISYYRKNKNNQNSDSLENENLIVTQTQSENFEKNEKIKMLYTFIHKLDSLNKALILMYLDEFTHDDIADTLGISKTNVATKINRIKKKLAKCFKLGGM